MKTKKNKALKSLADDLNTYDSTHNGDKGTIQSLVECCLNIQNDNKRRKAISEIIGKSESVRKLLAENEQLVTAEVEQALIRAATGYTVTEKKLKIVNGKKMIETVVKQIPPNQSAMEFYLINKSPENYKRNPDGVSDGGGKIDEIMEALKNAKN